MYNGKKLLENFVTFDLSKGDEVRKSYTSLRKLKYCINCVKGCIY